MGFALQDLLPWIATAFAWAIYVFGAVYIPVRVVFIPPSSISISLPKFVFLFNNLHDPRSCLPSVDCPLSRNVCYPRFGLVLVFFDDDSLEVG